jgi:hypothetical protein
MYNVIENELEEQCFHAFDAKTENLTESEKDTLKELMKDVEFNNIEDFRKELDIAFKKYEDGV